MPEGFMANLEDPRDTLKELEGRLDGTAEAGKAAAADAGKIAANGSKIEEAASSTGSTVAKTEAEDVVTDELGLAALKGLFRRTSKVSDVLNRASNTANNVQATSHKLSEHVNKLTQFQTGF